MTVSIEVDLDARKAKAEMGTLKALLEDLDDDVNLDLGLDGDLGDTLDDLSDTLDELGDSFTKDLDESIDRLENLELDALTVEGNGDSGGDTGSDSGDGRYTPDDKGRIFSHSNRMKEIRKAGLYGTSFGDLSRLTQLSEADLSLEESLDLDEIQDRLDNLFGDSEWYFNTDKRTTDAMDDGKIYGDTPFGKMNLGEFDKRWGHRDVIPASGTSAESPDSGKNIFRRLFGKMDGMKSVGRKIVPTMRMWWSIIGALVPALGAFAVQAGGAAAAMLSVVGAGGALIGLGLIGHASTLEGSMEKAKLEMQEFKQELFETFQPTAQLFAPISSRFFDTAPNQLDKVAESMEGLTAYEDTVFSVFNGFTEFGAETIDIITANEQAISSLTMEFGGLLGSSILDFFRFLLVEAEANRDTLIQLGNTFKYLGIILYNVFNWIANIITVLNPLFQAFAGLTTLLADPLIGSLSILIAVFAGVMYAIGGLQGMLGGFITEMVMATLASYGLAEGLATLLSVASLLTGIGIAVWAAKQAHEGMKQAKKLRSGGMPAAGGSGAVSGYGSSSGGYQQNNEWNININGNPDESQIEGIKDIARTTTEDTITRGETRDTPEFGD